LISLISSVLNMYEKLWKIRLDPTHFAQRMKNRTRSEYKKRALEFDLFVCVCVCVVSFC
jgi:hypothetical protein